MKVSEWRNPWLERFSWKLIVDLNEGLCLAKSAFHGPTSDGYEQAMLEWETHHRSEFDLIEMSTFLRKMHRLAPFCFFNGNTFVSVARNVLGEVSPKLSGGESIILRSVVGHYVAGTIDLGELENSFQSMSEISI